MEKLLTKEPPLFVKVALLLLFCLGVYQFYQTSERYTSLGSDFTQDYVAGFNVRHGASIYGESITEAASSRLGFTNIENFHPPFLALPFAPLSFLSYSSAHFLLNVVTLLLFLSMPFLIFRELKITKHALWYLIPLSLFWHPFIEVVALGQVSMLIAAAVTAGWIARRRGLFALSGVMFGIAALIKLFPGFLGVYLLFTRQWRALFFMSLTVLVGGIAALYVLGIQDIITYITVIAPKDIEAWSRFPANTSIKGSVYPLFISGRWVQPFIESHLIAQSVVTALYVVVVLTTVIMVARSRKSEFGLDLGFSLSLCAMIMLSPIAWPHNLPILLVPLLLLFKEVQDQKRYLSVALLVVLCFSLPTYALIRDLQEFTGEAKLGIAQFALTRGGAVGILVLFVMLLKLILNNTSLRAERSNLHSSGTATD